MLEAVFSSAREILLPLFSPSAKENGRAKKRNKHCR